MKGRRTLGWGGGWRNGQAPQSRREKRNRRERGTTRKRRKSGGVQMRTGGPKGTGVAAGGCWGGDLLAGGVKRAGRRAHR